MLAGRGPRARRSAADWTLDLLGILMQGWVVPFAAGALAAHGLGRLSPATAGALALPGWAAFALNFVGVDYLYYWNHRLLHGPLWRVHAVHHTAECMDVWVTARNGLTAPLFIVYVWANALSLHLLADPRPYLLAAAVTAALDLWRHSTVRVSIPGLISPDDHAWHHSRERQDVNFGSNFKLWDRLHGTYLETGERPTALGLPLDWSLARRLL